VSIVVRPITRRVDESDVDLLARVVRGELGALGELYDRYARDVWRVAFRMVGSAEDAEDVVHQVFMKLPQIAASHDGRANVRSWVLGIAVRIASRHRRSAGRFLKMIASFANAFATTSPADPERQATVRDELHKFELALAKLSTRKRDAFALIEIEGMTSDEAAHALGVPAATVRTRLHHARRELAEWLERAAETDRGRHE
jgi:RNA polymerase sigma-70 factor (ECF subfamily)